MMDKDTYLSTLHAISGGVAGSASLALLYPLDYIRTRLQLKNHDYKGGFDCFKKIFEKEGVRGFYKGLKSAVLGSAFSSMIYFYWYSLFKAWTLRLQQSGSRGGSLAPGRNILIASCAGAVNVLLTLPIWVVNTRMKLASYPSMTACARSIVAEDGVAALWNGLVPSLILCSNPAVQFVVYEQLTSALRRLRNKAKPASVKLSVVEYFVLGAVGKAVATVVTYPYQVVKSRVQACAKRDQEQYRSVNDAFARIWREEGWAGFYGGLGTKLSQTVLTSAFMFVFYEEIFHSLLKSSMLLRETQPNIKITIPSIPDVVPIAASWPALPAALAPGLTPDIYKALTPVAAAPAAIE